jgi:hypothetical protein
MKISARPDNFSSANLRDVGRQQRFAVSGIADGGKIDVET